MWMCMSLCEILEHAPSLQKILHVYSFLKINWQGKVWWKLGFSSLTASIYGMYHLSNHQINCIQMSAWETGASMEYSWCLAESMLTHRDCSLENRGWNVVFGRCQKALTLSVNDCLYGINKDIYWLLYWIFCGRSVNPAFPPIPSRRRDPQSLWTQQSQEATARSLPLDSLWFTLVV